MSPLLSLHIVKSENLNPWSMSCMFGMVGTRRGGVGGGGAFSISTVCTELIQGCWDRIAQRGYGMLTWHLH